MRSIPTRHVLYGVFAFVLASCLILVYHDTLLDTVQSRLLAPPHDDELETPPVGVMIRDKVATITDTLFTPHLIPIILYYHSMLGPSWPIVFFTSQETYDEHFSPNATTPSTSAAWDRALASGAIETRIITDGFDLKSRKGVNLYFSNPWLWEQLAPAKHVLVFQADSILCANARQTVDDFLEYDFIGAPLNDTRKIFNGGLSLRNRTMLLEVLNDEDRDWWTDWNTKGTGTEYGGHGEDVWMSIWMRERGAKLPTIERSLEFSRQLPWHMGRPGKPLGYHRVYHEDRTKIPEIRKWCPEIDLSIPGKL